MIVYKRRDALDGGEGLKADREEPFGIGAEDIGAAPGGGASGWEHWTSGEVHPEDGGSLLALGSAGIPDRGLQAIVEVVKGEVFSAN